MWRKAEIKSEHIMCSLFSTYRKNRPDTDRKSSYRIENETHNQMI